MKIFQIFISLIFICSAFSIDLKGSIVANELLSSTELLSPSTIILLSSVNILKKTHPTSKGYFCFKNVAKGSYLLEVLSSTHMFDSLRIDVFSIEEALANGLNISKDENIHLPTLVQVHQVLHGYAWDDYGKKMQYPIQLSPIAIKSYEEKQEPLKILSLLKNPIVHIFIITAISLFIFPKLTTILDMEKLTELQESQVQRRNNLSNKT